MLKKIALLFFLCLHCLNTKAQNYSRAQLDSFATTPVPQLISQSEKLIPVYREVAKQQQQNNLHYNEAKCYDALRLMHSYIGQYDSATYYSIKALNIFEKYNYKKEAAYYYAEAGYSAKDSNLPLAEKQMQRGLAIMVELKDTLGLAGQYNNYGVIKEFKEEYDSAGYYYQLSLDLKYKLKDTLTIPYAIMNIGTLAGILKNYKQAEDSLSKAAHLFSKIKNVPTEAECIFELAEILYKEKKYQKAINTFNECITVAATVSYLRLVMSCHKRLSEINEETDNLKTALFHRKQYNILYDSLMNETGIKAVADMQTKYEVAKKEEQIARQEVKITDRNNQMLVGFIMIGLIGFGVFYYIKRLRFKKEVEKIEHENKMRQERERISRDLHDNIGSQLAFLVSGAQLKKDDKQQQLNQLGEFANDTLQQLRTTVWAIKKDKITVQEFAEKVSLFIEKIKANSMIEFQTNVDVKANGTLSPTQSVHLYRVLQESISNAVKHSECFTITTSIRSEKEQLLLSINDDGIGYDANEQQLGNGLQFMKERMRELSGEYNIVSNESGTRINCQVKINT